VPVAHVADNVCWKAWGMVELPAPDHGNRKEEKPEKQDVEDKKERRVA